MSLLLLLLLLLLLFFVDVVAAMVVAVVAVVVFVVVDAIVNCYCLFYFIGTSSLLFSDEMVSKLKYSNSVSLFKQLCSAKKTLNYTSFTTLIGMVEMMCA